MKFSILVPVYNVEKYLEQCVDSLLNQTYKGEYEIILVNDGSTDSSGKICDKFKENHPEKVKVIHKENGGHTSARLEAIKNASGEYSLFCDSDDFVESSLLETVDKVLRNNPDTDMVMYSFNYYENGAKRKREISVFEGAEIFENESKKKLYEILITTPFLNSLCTKAIRTGILKTDTTDYGILKDKDIAEDAYIVSSFLTECKKIINITDSLYNYRTNRMSISRSYNPKKIERKNMLFLYERFVELLPIWGLDDEEHRQKLNARFFNEAMYNFSKYYENVHPSERKAVLEFDWSTFLPQDTADGKNNQFESKTYRSLYNCIRQKKYLKIKWFFLKKKARKFYKKVKAGVKL